MNEEWSMKVCRPLFWSTLFGLGLGMGFPSQSTFAEILLAPAAPSNLPPSPSDESFPESRFGSGPRKPNLTGNNKPNLLEVEHSFLEGDEERGGANRTPAGLGFNREKNRFS